MSGRHMSDASCAGESGGMGIGGKGMDGTAGGLMPGIMLPMGMGIGIGMGTGGIGIAENIGSGGSGEAPGSMGGAGSAGRKTAPVPRWFSTAAIRMLSMGSCARAAIAARRATVAGCAGLASAAARASTTADALRHERTVPPRAKLTGTRTMGRRTETPAVGMGTTGTPLLPEGTAPPPAGTAGAGEESPMGSTPTGLEG